MQGEQQGRCTVFSLPFGDKAVAAMVEWSFDLARGRLGRLGRMAFEDSMLVASKAMNLFAGFRLLHMPR